MQDEAKALGAVRQELRAGVLVLTLDHPPVNALSQDLRRDLADGLTRAEHDPEIHAVVLTGRGAQFSAGAEFAELGARRVAPDLPGLCLRIERFAKPVVAALQGNALGGGLELALAAQFRIGLASVHLGLPEVKLGILPGAGGTQRLPRLIGAEQALRLMLTGEKIPAAEALALGILDQVVEDRLIETAEAAALRLAGADWQGLRTAERREGMRNAITYQDQIRRARAGQGPGGLPAPVRIVDCVEAAALLPYDQGLAFEQVAFADLLATPEAQALRHAFQVERRAAFAPTHLAAVAPGPLAHVAILGAGGLAADVARAGLAAGLRVTLIEPQREVLVQAVEKIAALQELAVAEGRLAAETRDADWARLTPVAAPEAAGGADLVLRTTDSLRWPQDLACPPILGLGLPAPVALFPTEAAAELATHRDAPVATQALALALARRLGWRVVFTGPGGPIERRLRATLAAAIAHFEAQGVPRGAIAAALAGFGLGVPQRFGPVPAGAQEVVPGCLAALANQGARLLTEGVARRPGDIDAVAIAAGLLPRWRGGPMFLADRRGLMVLRADLRQRAATGVPIYRPAPLLDALIAESRDFAALNRG